MTDKFHIFLALSIVIGLPVGYLLRDGYARTHSDPPNTILSMFETRCLPMLKGQPARISGLIDAPMTLHDRDYIDPLSHLSLRADHASCTIMDMFAPLDAAQVQALVSLLRVRLPKLTGLTESDDIAHVGDISVGWMEGERLSTERWGVSLIQFGPGALVLSLHLPPQAQSSP